MVKRLSQNLWLTDIDSGDFENALLNLVINARDAMPSGGELILATDNCTLDEAFCALNPGVNPGHYVRLTVSDTGQGIEAENLERIFEPFYTSKPKTKGTGLGLAMVFGFVKRSEGHILVSSEPGVGTTFQIYLPRSEQQEKIVQIENPARKLKLPEGTETILVVDDEKGLLDLAAESLELLGYKVIKATCGKEALDRLDKNPDVTLLFSDVLMPGGMNGYELAEKALARKADLKVLLTSGYSDSTVAQGIEGQMEVNLLHKPYKISDLARRVRGLLEQTELV